MTLNNVIDLFRNIVTAHYYLRGFGFGNIFEQNGSLKEGLEYPLLWVVPLESTPFLQTKQRRFNLIVVDKVKKDKSNRNEVWSDTEQAMDDIVKILRYESDDYELKNDPVSDPIDEQYADWVTGWASPIVLETNLASNYCDIPKDEL